MENVSISITKSSVAEAVYRLTANAESERGDNAHVATSDNEGIVFAFVDDAAVLLDEAVERYGRCDVEGGNVVVSIDMPSNWGGDESVMTNAARVYLENYAVARWFELSGTAERFNNAAEVALMRVKQILDKRTKPTR